MDLHDNGSKNNFKHRYVQDYQELSDNIIYYHQSLCISAKTLKQYLVLFGYKSLGYSPRELCRITLTDLLALTDLFNISAEEIPTYHPWHDGIAYREAEAHLKELKVHTKQISEFSDDKD